MPPGREHAALGSAAALFRGLGDRSRLAIVCHLALGEHNVRDLTEHLGLAQSTVSAHRRCCILDSTGRVRPGLPGRDVLRPGHPVAIPPPLPETRERTALRAIAVSFFALAGLYDPNQASS